MADINVSITQGQIVVADMNRGYSGVSGFSGRSGFSGANPGASGVSGTSGKSGFSGRSGFSGTSGVGTSGVSGRSGTSGISGTSGVSGTSGISGTSGGGGAWASWTPTWTNLSVGDGTVVAKYNQTGKKVTARLSLVFGSTTSVSGLIQFTLPVTSVVYPGTLSTQNLGFGSAYDTGALTYQIAITWESTTKADVEALGSGGTYTTQVSTSGSIPFSWGTGDELNCQFVFEAS